MLLPFNSDLTVTSPFDAEMSMLADRHYSRRSPGARQFLNNGRKIVIRDRAGLVLFGWLWPQDGMRFDDQTGYNCAIFRNESSRLASEILLECEQIAIERWGPNRMYTYVDSRKIQKTRQPGRCFIKAGWSYARNADGTRRMSKAGLHLLVKEPISTTRKV
jgi:hypothetical protein